MRITIVTLTVFLTIIVLTVFSVQNASADESFTLGLKYWYPEWESHTHYYVINYDQRAGMYGLVGTLDLSEKFAITTTIFYGDFTTTTLNPATYGYGGNYGENTDYFETSRSDIGLACSYKIHQFVHVFSGIRYLAFKENWIKTYEDDGNWYSQEHDLRAYGLELGVNRNYPFGKSGAALFGTFSYAYLIGDSDIKFDYLGSESEIQIQHDVIYSNISIEVGSSYTFKNIPVNLSVSYRYQQSPIKSSEGGITDNNDWLEEFSGFMLCASYRFPLGDEQN